MWKDSRVGFFLRRKDRHIILMIDDITSPIAINSSIIPIISITSSLSSRAAMSGSEVVCSSSKVEVVWFGLCGVGCGVETVSFKNGLNLLLEDLFHVVLV